MDTSIALQVEKFHADADERRKEKEAARIRREAAQAARCAASVVAWLQHCAGVAEVVACIACALSSA